MDNNNNSNNINNNRDRTVLQRDYRPEDEPVVVVTVVVVVAVVLNPQKQKLKSPLRYVDDIIHTRERKKVRFSFFGVNNFCFVIVTL